MSKTNKETKVTETVQNTEEMVNTGVPEFTEDQKEYARMTVRTEFNKNFDKWAHIEDDNATDDDIAAAKADYEAAIKETQERTYVIAKAEGNCAIRTVELLIEWNNKMNPWSNGEWRGVVAFETYMQERLAELKSGKSSDLVIDYSTLCFLYNNMNRIYGVGYGNAQLMAKFENFDFEKNEVREEEYPVTYSGILEKINTEVNMLSNIDKKLTILRERLNLAYAGLKMTLKVSDLEEFIEFADAINNHTVKNEMTSK